jgi:wyosine [tRNA(Phe)-imidazoG37] synthetase (radical SAM superfamily)
LKGRTKPSIVYGPVLSWRLGRSLGIDVVPPPKACTFDCIYCQLGRTVSKLSGPVEPRVRRDSVLGEVERTLDNVGPGSIDYITFSGSGEPTLDPELGSIIDGLKHQTDRPIAVLTNSSLVHRDDVRGSLARADLVVAKLDAPNQMLLEAINRPAEGILHEKIVEGLRMLKAEMSGRLALQMMFLRSTRSGAMNAEHAMVDLLIRCADKIMPDEIQVNTPTRPPSEKYVEALEPPQLEAIAERFKDSFECVRVVSIRGVEGQPSAGILPVEEVEERCLSLIRRRPCGLEEIAAGLKLSREAVAKSLKALETRRRIVLVKYGGRAYFKISDDDG